VDSKITNRQIFFLVCVTLTTYSSIAISKVMAQSAGTGGWLPPIVMSLVFSLPAILIARLGLLFPGRVLFEYSREIAGKFLAYLFSIYFIMYFLAVAVFLNVQLSSVLKAEFFLQTPPWATLAAGLIVFGCIAYMGVTSVARFFEIVGPLFFISAIIVHVIMLIEGNVNNILPLFRTSEMMRYASSPPKIITPLLGAEALTVFPLTRENSGKAGRTIFWAFVSVGLFYVLAIESCIMMLGIKDIQNFAYPLIEAIRLIDVPVIERVDFLYLTVGFSGLIAGASITFLVLVEYLIKLLPHANRKLVTALVCLLTFILGLTAQAAKGAGLFMEQLVSIAGLGALFLIPIILMVIAKVKGYGKKAR
jgi:spore germination protein (amino acid permease)